MTPAGTELLIDPYASDSPTDLGEIDAWLEGRSNVERRGNNKLDLGPDTLPTSPTIIVLRHSPAVVRARGL